MVAATRNRVATLLCAGVGVALDALSQIRGAGQIGEGGLGAELGGMGDAHLLGGVRDGVPRPMCEIGRRVPGAGLPGRTGASSSREARHRHDRRATGAFHPPDRPDEDRGRESR